MNDLAQKRLDDLIASFDTAMLVTTSLSGQPRARPMAIAGHDKGGLLYFATRAEDEKMNEILEHPHVAVTMQGDARFLSITGEARIETNVQLARSLWQPSMQLWFPNGANDPQLTLILIDPVYAEYWDRSGLRRLEFLWEAGKALVRGEAMDEPSAGDHAKVVPD
ncbi:MAG: pyridoxamine 5'-phosphate oxidase family protein [Xanthomonadales bacterium]